MVTSISGCEGSSSSSAMNGSLDELPRRVGDEAAAAIALLANRDHARFDPLAEALPPTVLAFIDDLSPLRVRDTIRAPVELVVPLSDVYFPLRPRASLAPLKDLAAFDGFVVRGLSGAS